MDVARITLLLATLLNGVLHAVLLILFIALPLVRATLLDKLSSVQLLEQLFQMDLAPDICCRVPGDSSDDLFGLKCSSPPRPSDPSTPQKAPTKSDTELPASTRRKTPTNSDTTTPRCSNYPLQILGQLPQIQMQQLPALQLVFHLLRSQLQHLFQRQTPRGPPRLESLRIPRSRPQISSPDLASMSAWSAPSDHSGAP